MPNLFPENYDKETIEAEDLKATKPVGYRNGAAFDYEIGDFIRNGKNRIIDSNGIDSWKSWCVNCVQTERFSHLGYGTDFGIETGEAMKANSKEEAESILAREITEALLADPYDRTEYVEDIEFNWTAPDAVEASVIIHGVEDVTIDITAYITEGGV